MKKGKIVVVLTMGSSGSSAVARGLKILGVGLGEKINDYSVVTNKKGIWENMEIGNTCAHVLKSLDTDALTPDGIDKLDINKVPEYLRDRAMELIKDHTDKYDLFGFKNTMSWKIIPFLNDIFRQLSLQPTYIVVVRNPVDFVSSLAKKTYKKKTKVMYAFWLECVVTIMNNTRENSRLVVDYDQMLVNPEHQMQRLAKVLDIDENDIDKAALREYLDEFIDKKMRHHADFSFDKINEEAYFPILTQKSYELLQDLAVDNLSIESPEVSEFFHDCYLQLRSISQLFKTIKSIESDFLSISSTLKGALLELSEGQYLGK